MKLFVGSYAKKIADTLIEEGKGIYELNLDKKTGALTLVGVTKVTCPSYLALDDGGDYLYTAEELPLEEGPLLRAFEIDHKESLTPIDQQELPGGYPCHLVMDGTQKYVLVACYMMGNIWMYPKNSNGRLSPFTAKVDHKGNGPNTERQEAPHPHMLQLFGDQHLLVTDLGIDRVLAYTIDEQKGRLLPVPEMNIALPLASGPRHMIMHPDGKYFFVFTELTAQLFLYLWNGVHFIQLQFLETLPPSYTGVPSGAAIKLHPNRRYVYVSNRGANLISIFEIRENRLYHIAYQPTERETPRDFAIDPTGCFLLVANQDSHTIVVFAIDQETGELTKKCIFDGLRSPTCLVFWK